MRLGIVLAVCCLSSQVLAQNAAKPAPAQVEPPAGSVGGMGDVNLYPKRVVIDQRQRVASIGLFNRAAAQGEYDIDISDMMMTKEGGIVELASVSNPADKARVRTASALLRWSPHRVTLGSHDSQTVRIMARIAPDLPPGEYRSHFFAVAKPPVGEGGLTIEEAAGARASNGIGVMIVPRFGISIPIIVRVGETTLITGLRNLSVNTTAEGVKVLSLTITRQGTRSAFGDIVVTAAGTKTKVAENKGVGVYPEVSERTIQLLVDPAVDPRSIARGAKLTVTYTDDDFAPGKTLAKQDFIVP
jgi:hypothetical protein